MTRLPMKEQNCNSHICLVWFSSITPISWNLYQLVQTGSAHGCCNWKKILAYPLVLLNSQVWIASY